MIEFILNTKDNNIKEIINNTMIMYDYNYIIKNNINIIKNESYKIYIIDYDINNHQSINILKQIRYIENDWKSMIIIKTNNITKILSIISEYMIIQIVDKNNKKLKEGIIKSINNYDQHPNTLKYKYKGTYYNINLKDILYIEKEIDNKRCIIYTKKNSYKILISSNKILEKLDKRFIKCSRSYIVNLEQMISYNKKNNIIALKNNKQITEISRSKKQNIINYYRNVE